MILHADVENGPSPRDAFAEEFLNPDWDVCPEHGEQAVTRYGSTQGPDPYAVTKLECGHSVICMGPHEPNVII